MTRLRGWGRKGKPLLGKAPHGHWMTSTFVAGLRHDSIAAPMLLDTPMTGRIFQQWLTDHLIPELPPPQPFQRCFASPEPWLLRPAASWSATTCRPTRSPASASAWKPPAWGCSTCRPRPSPGQALQPRPHPPPAFQRCCASPEPCWQATPDRAGLRQAESAAPARSSPLVRRHTRRTQTHPRTLPSRRVRQLHPPLRLCANVNGADSSYLIDSVYPPPISSAVSKRKQH